MTLRVGNKVKKITAWCSSRCEELGEGKILKIEKRMAHVHWQNGETEKHHLWELIKI